MATVYYNCYCGYSGLYNCITMVIVDNNLAQEHPRNVTITYYSQVQCIH